MLNKTKLYGYYQQDEQSRGAANSFDNGVKIHAQLQR